MPGEVLDAMTWRSARSYVGTWRGRRVAHVVDTTLGGDLVVVFGRFRSWKDGKVVKVADFAEWVERWRAKRV